METNHIQSPGKTSSRSLRYGMLALLILLCSFPTWAEKQEFTKKKEFNKSFNASKNDLVEVDNRFGNITITYWNKNEVSIRVVVEAKARNAERAQAYIDRVNIEMEKSGNTISAITSLTKNMNGGSNESFSINYYINMPSGITCDLNQKYGNINMPENNAGKCMLHTKYGNVNGGSFSGSLEIETQYGNIDITDIKGGEFDLSYGNAKINNATAAYIESKYSNVNIGQIDKLEMDIKYGNFEIGNINKGDLEVKYSQGNIRYLKNELSLDALSYSTVNILELSAKFGSINVDAHYGNLDIKIPSDASFRVVAEDMKYGDFNIRGFNISRSHVEDKVNHTTEVNGGRDGKIYFSGNNYGNLNIITK